MEIRNPDHNFFIEFLKPYYLVTADGQYLFGTMQKGRRPDRVFYMVSDDYCLGKGQRRFDLSIGRRIFEVVDDYARGMSKIVQDGVQGEGTYETGMRVIMSIENPHAAYMAWMGKLMMFPQKDICTSCINHIIPERLPVSAIARIREKWPEFDENAPLTLFDFINIDNDIRRVVNLRIDYFGGAYKKPNLTMVWNRAEQDGLISYHAGCCNGRILKGLSGTGKTTLTVGKNIYQDDALVGRPLYKDKLVAAVEIVGLEAASFAKSEGLSEKSPEWKGLMKSREGRIVLAMNIDCEGVTYQQQVIAGHQVVVPVTETKVGCFQCRSYTQSGTTNGRFIFQFSDLNPQWGSTQMLRSEGLSFRRFDILEPLIVVTDPVMAVALDSGCESVITSAIEGKVAGSRVRVYAATDFMAREQAEQALLKLDMYRSLGLDPQKGLLFFVVNTGFVGEHDRNGFSTKCGEKIQVADSKRLIDLAESGAIRRWIEHPAFRYLIPDPLELETEHNMKHFCRRFNLLRYYTSEDICFLIRRDIEERTQYLKNLFERQRGECELHDVITFWEKCSTPSVDEIRIFYEKNYADDEE